jgi:hypothetical protein
MAEAGLNLFIVEWQMRRARLPFRPGSFIGCRNRAAKVVAKEAQAQETDVIDPFPETGSEVRVGNFESPGSQSIIFGDWSPVT